VRQPCVAELILFKIQSEVLLVCRQALAPQPWLFEHMRIGIDHRPGHSIPPLAGLLEMWRLLRTTAGHIDPIPAHAALFTMPSHVLMLRTAE
jgi:hypothetical protein